jgi:hypothetical protein
MTADPAGTIDALMDQASEALVGTEYFKAETLCLRALAQARKAADFERLARIALPLQEARRQVRQIATDAAAAGAITVLSKPPARAEKFDAGFYLCQPPMIGKQARALRELLTARQIPALVLCREPLTRAGAWPIVAVTEGYEPGLGAAAMFGHASLRAPQGLAIRAYIAPPAGVERTDSSPTRDNAWDGSIVPSVAWFLAASESLGDAAIARASREPIYRVDDLLDGLDAVPEHEKLHQRLADAAMLAVGAPMPRGPRMPESGEVI